MNKSHPSNGYTVHFFGEPWDSLNCQLDTIQNHLERVPVLDCLDEVGLWACLLGVVLPVFVDVRRTSLMWVAPSFGLRSSKALEWSRWAELLSTVVMLWLAVVSLHCLDFPAMMDYDWNKPFGIWVVTEMKVRQSLFLQIINKLKLY